MLYTLKNDVLTVTVNSVGAELMSIRRADCEYLWQGDAAYWDERAPVLFPICGRVWSGKYTYDGKTYEMGAHGFARGTAFSAEVLGEDRLRLTLSANEMTRAQYPFEFVFSITYSLDGDTLHSEMCIRNTDQKVLPATAGGHPGFHVPLGGDGKFEDWYLEFSEECSPDEMLLSGVCYFSGKKKGMTLEDGKILRLTHRLFDEEGVFLHRAADTVTLKSDTCERFVRMHYPDMPYLGFWQPAKCNAPLLCIEPWCGFAGYDGVVDDFATKNDMFRIPVGGEKTVRYSLQFG